MVRITLLTILAGLSLCLGAGCGKTTNPGINGGRVKLTEEVRTRMTTTISGNMATLQWKSQKGVLYNILYAESRSRGAQWRPHPNYQNVPGTGSTITIKDRMSTGVKRHYRLNAIPIR